MVSVCDGSDGDGDGMGDGEANGSSSPLQRAEVTVLGGERERATHTTQKIEANFECFLEAIQSKIPKVLELRPSARKGLGSPNIRMLKSDQMFQFHCSLKG